MSDRRIIAYSLEQARAAVEAAAELGVAVTLMSARGMAGFMGPLWFKVLTDDAAETHPDVPVTAILDCADEPGTVLAALRTGLKRVRFTGAEETRLRLDDIARQLGAKVEGDEQFDALDLLDSQNPRVACLTFLAGN